MPSAAESSSSAAQSSSDRGAAISYNVHMRRALISLVVASTLISVPAGQAPLDRDGERWVEQTMKKLTTDEIAGQMLMVACFRDLHQF